MKTLWVAVLTNPIWMRRAHGFLTVLWTVMLPVAVLTSLKTSLPFLVAINVYALMVGHWSSWQSARVEVKQFEIEAAKDQDAESRIEKKVEQVAQTIQAVVPEEAAEKTVKKLNGY